MLDIACVIFAGGKSSRMGEDKALLPFGGFDTLSQFQHNRLSKIFKNVYISCKTKTKFNFKADFIEDIYKDKYAPSVGFLSVFEKLGKKAFFAISVDTPFVDEQIIDKIYKADSLHVDATIAKLDGKIQPMCGIYHPSLIKEFQKMYKNDAHKLGILLKNSNVKFVNFDDKKAFTNINYQDEYKASLELFATK